LVGSFAGFLCACHCFASIKPLFMGTELDVLVIGSYYLSKEDQAIDLVHDYKNKYELD